MARGAIILIENEAVAVIERIRAGRTYYLFPGGGVEPGETIEQAAVREAREELGLDVRLGRRVAIVTFDGNEQHYFLAEAVGGIFGSGDGAEYESAADSEAGSYRPTWIPVRQLTEHDVRPRELAATVRGSRMNASGEVLYIQE